MTQSFLWNVMAVGVLFSASNAWSANNTSSNLSPNPGFEQGDKSVASWHSDDPQAAWDSQAHQGGHALVVHGDGKNSFAWISDSVSLTPGGLYRLEYFAVRDSNSTGGLVVSGIQGVNHDFGAPAEWKSLGFNFMVPHNRTQSWIRLGQWELNGAVRFDDVVLHPLQAVHEPYGESCFLGEGESVKNNVYRFNAWYGWDGANYHHPLFVNHCAFNTDRWTFEKGSEVVYHHKLPSDQTSASLKIAFNYYMGGTLQVEASRDGKSWVAMESFDSKRKTGTNSLPASLFPAAEIYIRLSTTNADANFQVSTYDYESPLKGIQEDKVGATHFLEVIHADPQVDFTLLKIHGETEKDTDVALECEITNRVGPLAKGKVSVSVDGEFVDSKWQVGQSKATASKKESVSYISFPVKNPGRHGVSVSYKNSDGNVLFEGKTQLFVPILSDSRAGYYAGGSKDVSLWWSESAWKIGRFKSWPKGSAAGSPKPITVSAARGEWEPFQLILNPGKAGVKMTAATLKPFLGKKGANASISSKIERQAYVQVTRATDGDSRPGWYPDPLPTLELPYELPVSENTPLWITLHVARETTPGDYLSQVQLETSAGVLTVPVKLHVYNFEIPRVPHLRTALGMGGGDINRFHHLQKQEDRELVYDKYLTNFVEHRISPYSFFEYAGMDIRFKGEGTNKIAEIDFSRFDKAAEKWIDQEGFTSFILPLRGMGGGTFSSRYLGDLEGFKEGTPEHAMLFKQYLGKIEDHLKSRGWMDKAYAYWFDEPEPKDYEFVSAGMQRIKAACPGLKRMLTKQPAPLLEGNVDIWCALTPEWTPERVKARRDAGQEVWWYICCGPTSPYITEFIDHPGSELRLWPWQSWQYGVQGLLVWATTYWTSDCAYPGGKPQDPWKDPMSYVSGYEFQAGYMGYWGNGDGRFLYPPQEVSSKNEPCLKGPVNSVRWENLRDGMEDYEYFWLLDQAIKQAEKQKTHGNLLDQARQLLKIPAAISTDTTHFTTDARLLMEHRDRVAKMIEKLQAP